MVQTGWRMVEKNQERISNLVMDMLTFSKERKPDLVPADLNQVAADVIELMQARADDGGVALVARPADAMPQLMFDPEGLHRAILNVVTNAIDACEKREDGRITVTTEFDKTDRLARVIVEDNGAGIDPGDLEMIFTVFESKKGSRGTGLGLPSAKRFSKSTTATFASRAPPAKAAASSSSSPSSSPPKAVLRHDRPSE